MEGPEALILYSVYRRFPRISVSAGASYCKRASDKIVHVA